MSSWYLYGIRDNIEGSKYRYVGYTTTSIQDRLSLHLFEARKGEKPYAVYDWMRSRDFDVVSEEIDSVVAEDKDLLYDREKHWISFYRNLQGSLTDRLTPDYLLNHTDGGGGALGYRHTPEECERRRGQVGYWTGITGEAHPSYGKTNSEAHRKAVSVSYKTNPRSGKDSHRYGVVTSDTTKLKQSFSKHRRFHSDKIKETCKWCLGADLQEEIQKRENELNDNKVG